MKVKILFVILLITFNSNAQLTNSYKRIKKPTLTNDSLDNVIDVRFNSSKTSKKTTIKPKKTIFDLSERAQDELIVTYSKFESDSKTFRANLIEPLEKPKIKVKSIIDKSFLTMPRTFELFIEDNWYKVNSANRIASVKISITLNDNNMVKFSKFNGYLTKHEYFDLGTIEETNTRNFSLNAGIGASTSNTNNNFDDVGNQIQANAIGYMPSVSGSFGTSNSFKENIVLKKRFITQTGSLTDTNISIYMEGAPLRNLNGPIKVDFDFKAIGETEIPLEIVKFSLNDKKEPKLDLSFLIVPKINTTVKANMEVEWLYRKVVRNGNTSYEGDDIIQYYRYIKKYDNLPIFKEEDVKNKFFTLRYKDENDTKSHRVYVENQSGAIIILRFKTQEEAIKFLKYILEKKNNVIDGYTIKSKLDNKAIPASLLKKIFIESDSK